LATTEDEPACRLPALQAAVTAGYVARLWERGDPQYTVAMAEDISGRHELQERCYVSRYSRSPKSATTRSLPPRART
jgi:hypothetical protein